MRSKFINNDVIEDWTKETPYEIRDQAMIDIFKALKTIKANNHTNWKFKFRSKKDKTETISILSKCYNPKTGQVGSLIRSMKAVWNKNLKQLPLTIQYDAKLTRNKLGEYYFCIPKPLDLKSENQAPEIQSYGDGVISIDPGVRTFMTGFEASGSVYEWGKSDFGRIQRLCYYYDRLQSRISKIKGPKSLVRNGKQCVVKAKRARFYMRKAQRRIQRKIRNLIDCVHHNVSKWLCENFYVILLPKFQTSNMVIKRKNGKKRVITSKTARAMLTWSHYRFRQYLINKTREYPWVHLMFVDEDFSTLTCGNCGHIHTNIKGSKVFNCPKCNFTIDRDINGARNIMLKYLTSTISPIACKTSDWFPMLQG